TNHVTKDLCKASRAIGCVAAASTEATDDGVLQWVVRGPVWAALPQTAPFVEHVALVIVSDTFMRMVQPFVDCMSVIKEAAMSLVQQLRPSSKYVGIRLLASCREGFEKVMKPTHVKAHRSLEDIRQLRPQERAVAMENRSIDEHTQVALCNHPPISQDWVKEINRLAERAGLAVRMIAHTLIQCPKEHRQSRLRGPMRRYGSKVRWHS
ncbi:MAG: hypothetical protein ACKPKO_26570, partial [Candidatus Fonsibacter sp.]